MFEQRFRSHHHAQHAIAKLIEPSRPNRPEMGAHPPGNDEGGKPAAMPVKPPASAESAPGRPPQLASVLKRVAPSPAAGVYIHVPWCDTLCSFCNLNRCKISRSLDPRDDYVATLIEQIRACGETEYSSRVPLEAIYFGGGTPTTLTPRHLRKLVDAVTHSFPQRNPDRELEITVETTVHNLSTTMVDALIDAGVNRFSVGVQTFDSVGRVLLARTGDGAWARDRIAAFRARFRGTLSIDLIYAYPGYDDDHAAHDVETAVSLDVDSVSFYSLMIQPDSPLDQMIRSGTVALDRTPEDELTVHNALVNRLSDHGFVVRELTKSVRPDRDRYRYIDLMYGAGDVLPFGAGAGGRVGEYAVMRPKEALLMVVPQSAGAIAANRALGYLQLGQYHEAELLQLIAEAVGAESSQRFAAEHALRDRLRTFERFGYISSAGDSQWNLTPTGVFWGNNIAVDLVKHAKLAVDGGAAVGARKGERA